MESFSHHEETIAAIATAPGEGGVAIIRISGKRAVELTASIYSGRLREYESHTLHLGKIIDPIEGKVIDEVMIAVMKAPRSYTGEETVEIQCHGGALVTRRVLETVLNTGVRAAGPGEFTFKAYMNGKIDLAQAEAVKELIAAKNNLALDIAANQLKGALSKKIKQFQEKLIDTAAILEASIDFPEDELESTSLEEIVFSMEELHRAITRLKETFHEGKIIHEGITLSLFGEVNVGKSSLMNHFLKKERAIVSDIPGTTRDRVEAEMRLGEFHFRLIDTAGIRATNDPVEQEGIRRSYEAIHESGLVLLVFDSTTGNEERDQELLNQVFLEKTIVLWNKIDLPSNRLKPPCALPVSAKSGIGFDAVYEAIHHKIWSTGVPAKDEVIITNLRHKQALDDALHSIQLAIRALKEGLSPEFVVADVRQALSELGTIIGINIGEDILTAIFSKFCIGK